jgi:hypothetical protein
MAKKMEKSKAYLRGYNDGKTAGHAMAFQQCLAHLRANLESDYSYARSQLHHFVDSYGPKHLKQTNEATE